MYTTLVSHKYLTQLNIIDKEKAKEEYAKEIYIGIPMATSIYLLNEDYNTIFLVYDRKSQG